MLYIDIFLSLLFRIQLGSSYKSSSYLTYIRGQPFHFAMPIIMSDTFHQAADGVHCKLIAVMAWIVYDGETIPN